ncbi:MAG: hypothetical protein IPJ77_04015 [Planctomycetes bacterium]|nr:hypothetical protein [Planctomycetota bacterium]
MLAHFTLLGPLLLVHDASIGTPCVALAARDPSLARDDEELARELAQLAAPPSAGTLSGWLQARYAWSADVDANGARALAASQLDTVRLAWSWGDSAPVSGTVSLEAGDPATSDAETGVGTLDAFLVLALSSSWSVTVGRFSSTVLWSSGLSARERLFLDSSFLGEAWDGRDVGFEVAFARGRWNAWAAVQNGSDATGDGFALSARVSVQALPAREEHDALGSESRLVLGAAWFDDTRLDDGAALVADASYASSRWSIGAEWVDFGEAIGPEPVTNAATGAIVPSIAGAAGARSSWNASGAVGLIAGEWELALRWQDLDDAAETTVATAALVRLVDDRRTADGTRGAGPSARWIAQFDHARSTDRDLEHDVFALGLVVGF